MSKSKKRKVEPRDVQFRFYADYVVEDEHCTHEFTQSAMLTDSEAAVVEDVLRVLLPYLGREVGGCGR